LLQGKKEKAMQQNFSFRELTRTVLTVTGLILLIIFGSRAASQASSITAVRGQPARAVFGAGFALGELQIMNNKVSLSASARSSTSASENFVATDPSRGAKQRVAKEAKKTRDVQEGVTKNIASLASSYENSRHSLKTDVK
jgi:hypothetical protein